MRGLGEGCERVVRGVKRGVRGVCEGCERVVRGL